MLNPGEPLKYNHVQILNLIFYESLMFKPKLNHKEADPKPNPVKSSLPTRKAGEAKCRLL